MSMDKKQFCELWAKADKETRKAVERLLTNKEAAEKAKKGERHEKEGRRAV